MARLLRIEYAGAFYHVTSRGNERKDVFKSQLDREKFLSYMESEVVRYGAVAHTWCPMPNHGKNKGVESLCSVVRCCEWRRFRKPAMRANNGSSWLVTYNRALHDQNEANR